MSTPLAKRRKLDSAAALSKPFKSPMRRPPQDTDKVSTAQSEATSFAVVEANTNPLIKKSASQVPLPALGPEAQTQHSLTSTASPTVLDGSKPAVHQASLTEVRSLQRENAALLNQLASVRSTLDTNTQALKISRSTRDLELQRLVGLWRTASRSAAEELFATAKDRVNGMGGLGAWKEKERGRREGWGGGGSGWDERESENRVGLDEEMGGYGTNMLRAEVEGEGDLDLREEGAQEAWEETGDEDEVGDTCNAKQDLRANTTSKAFTINMMLRSLSIDLALIGYDKETQRWVD